MRFEKERLLLSCAEQAGLESSHASDDAIAFEDGESVANQTMIRARGFLSRVTKEESP